MNKITAFLAVKRLATCERLADYWHGEQRRLSLAAYAIPDMMAEPLRWGHLQNAANWARHRCRTYRSEAERLRSKLLNS